MMRESADAGVKHTAAALLQCHFKLGLTGLRDVLIDDRFLVVLLHVIVMGLALSGSPSMRAFPSEFVPTSRSMRLMPMAP